MQQYNNIPKTGTFGGAVDKINENFLLTYVAIGNVEYETRKNKGLFPDATSLSTAIPNPKQGDWALVSDDGFPAELYVCNTDGTWTDSGETYSGDNVDLNDYLTKADFNVYKNSMRPLNIYDTNQPATLSDGPGNNAVSFTVDMTRGFKLTVHVARANTSGYHYTYDFYEYDSSDNLVYRTPDDASMTTENTYTAFDSRTSYVKVGIREYNGTSYNQLRKASVTQSDFTYDLQGGMAQEWRSTKEIINDDTADIDLIKRKIFGTGSKIMFKDTDWKYGYYTAAGAYTGTNTTLVYTYFRIKGTAGFKVSPQIVNFVDKDFQFISNIADYSSTYTEVAAANYPANAEYICVSLTKSAYFNSAYCELQYGTDVLAGLAVETSLPTLRNGSAANSGNAVCVATNNAIAVNQGDVIIANVKKTIPDGCRAVFCGSGVLHFDYSPTTTENIFVVPADGECRVGFTIYDPEDGDYIAQRIGTGGNVSDGDLELVIYRSGTIYSEIQKLYTPDAYIRNRDKDEALAAAVRCNATANGSKDLGLLIITDSHSDPYAERNSILIANGFKYVDALIHLGDFCASTANDFQTDVWADFLAAAKPFYFVVGNHDVGNSKVKTNCLTNAETYTRYIASLVTAGYLESGEYTDGKCYYYHDFTEYNIRLIVCYEFDDPNDSDSSDSTKYKITRGMSVISSAQAQWFCDTLASTPYGYNVVVALHGPFSDNATSANYKFSQADGVAGNRESLHLFSTDFWADAVDAYVNRRNFSIDMVNTGDAAYLNSNGKYWTVTKNFSSAEGGFLCFLGGHRHKDLIFVHNTYKYQKQIDCICANTTNYANAAGSDISRSQTDSPSKDSLTFVGFNNTDKSASLVKIGVGLTKAMTTRDVEKIVMDNAAIHPTDDVVYVEYWQSSTPATYSAGLYWYDTTNNLLKRSVADYSGQSVGIRWETVKPSTNVFYIDITNKTSYVYSNNRMLEVGGGNEVEVTLSQYERLTPETGVKYLIYENI